MTTKSNKVPKEEKSHATHHSKPQHAGVSFFWDHVNGGELSAIEVRKARRLEVEYLNKVKVVERLPYSFIKHKTGKEPVKVRWVDTLKTNDGFMNFPATPPLELVRLHGLDERDTRAVHRS